MQKVTEVTQKAGDLWKVLEENAKKVYEDKAAALKATYTVEYAAYTETEAGKAYLAKAALEKAEAKKRKREETEEAPPQNSEKKSSGSGGGKGGEGGNNGSSGGSSSDPTVGSSGANPKKKAKTKTKTKTKSSVTATKGAESTTAPTPSTSLKTGSKGAATAVQGAETAKASTPEAASPSPADASVQGKPNWRCPTCNKKNKLKREKCRGCGKPRTEI